MNMPEPNIPALTRAVELVIDQYDDPEPGPMLRIIVSRGLDPDTGVGRSADRSPPSSSSLMPRAHCIHSNRSPWRR